MRRPIEIIDRRYLPQPPSSKTKKLSDKARLATAANFARFKIPDTFPEVKAAWYIDSDALPITDLAGPAYAAFVQSGLPIQPVARNGTIAAQFDKAVL